MKALLVTLISALVFAGSVLAAGTPPQSVVDIGPGGSAYTCVFVTWNYYNPAEGFNGAGLYCKLPWETRWTKR